LIDLAIYLDIDLDGIGLQLIVVKHYLFFSVRQFHS